jgi:hypothetical protein
MRDDVLKTISSARDVTNAIVLTHNIDFIFIQTVVLRAMRGCGHPALTIFADAACATDSFKHQHPLLSSLGVRYRVVPVAMEAGFRFHPKAVFLSGEQAATLLVGSGNLTFGGWRENAEIWQQFDSEQDGAAPFFAFKDYLAGVLDRVPLPDAVISEVDEAFDEKTKLWTATDATGPAGLVGRAGSGDSMLGKMLDLVGDDPVEELVVCAPYFDDDGVALGELIKRAAPKKATVLCQPDRSTLTKRSWGPNSKQAVLTRVDYTRTNDSDDERSAFLHAKFYAFRRASSVTILAGSANCSRAALLASGRFGNAELQAVRVTTPAEFEQEFLGDLSLTSESVELRDDRAPGPEDEHEASNPLRILAARNETRGLVVAYAPTDIEVEACLVDGFPVKFTSAESGILQAMSHGDPRVVILRSWVDGVCLESAPAWVDHEHHLRATARGRHLVDSIRARFKPGELNAGAWAEVMNVLCKHMTYLPAHRGNSAIAKGEVHADPGDEVTYTMADVFAADFRRPGLGSLRIPALIGEHGREHSLQQLLLRWFGIAREEDEEEAQAIRENADSGNDGSEVVDHQENLADAAQPKQHTTSDVSPKDRRSIERVLHQLEIAMTSKEFLVDRDPGLLAADLKVTSVLLRCGLREGWISNERFFDLTQRVWSSLFFTSDQKKGKGWLEARATGPGGQAFSDDMKSAELSAALLGWQLAIPDKATTPEAAWFALASAIAYPRIPWLWMGGDQESVTEELAKLFAYTADPTISQTQLLEEAEAAWIRLQERGQALNQLQEVLSSIGAVALRKQIRSNQLLAGDLLWQGRMGFCVMQETFTRSGGGLVEVLQLSGETGKTKIESTFTIPVRALLAEEIIPPSTELKDGPIQVLKEFTASLIAGFST